MVVLARLVTFDVVDTIIRVRLSASQQYVSAAAKCGLVVSKDALKSVYKDTWIQHKLQHPLYGVHQGLSNDQFWRSFIHKVFVKLGFENEHTRIDKTADLLINTFKNDPQMYEKLPGALHMLDELRKRKFRLGVISNFDDTLKEALDKQQLSDYFEFIVTCKDAMAEKPDGRIFRHALRVAGVEAEEAVHVGDDVERDFHAARRVGMQALLLKSDSVSETALNAVPSDVIVQCLNDVPSFLKLIE